MSSLGFRCGKGTVRQYECGENYLVLNQGEGANFPDIDSCSKGYYVRICNKDGCNCETYEVKGKVGDKLYFSCIKDLKICKGQQVRFYDFEHDCKEKVICHNDVQDCKQCGEFKDRKRSYLRGALEKILKGNHSGR